MKRKRNEPGQRKSNDERAKTDQKVIFGTYQKIGDEDFILAKDGQYKISEIKRNQPQHIAQGNNIKALLRPSGKAMVLKVYEPAMSLKERIAQLLKESSLPVEFPEKVIREADNFEKKIVKSAYKKRLDLTTIALCTIDGESAKDFDDAVFASKKGKNFEVIIAIADVSHYVSLNSALDEEAVVRGTSIYFPGACVPMLPEQLSNGMCSLKPKVNRLAIAVSFEVGPKGGISKPKIREAIINSASRLTYDQVQKFYDGKPMAPGLLSASVKSSLIDLRDAAHILRKARERRGAIDFDLVESVVALDDNGEPLSIHPQDRQDSHRIIEDLMVATNEIVANFFAKKLLPCLYRVHEAPDQEKLANFFKTAHAFGVLDSSVETKAANIVEPKDLQRVMTLYRKSQYKETLNTLMLRSMKQARYSEQNIGHFGLASDAYLHFTSPIRRYADLMVHRQLRYMLFERNYKKKIDEQVMADIAEGISQKEIKATEIERKVDRIYQATFMHGRIGEVFDGTIAACTEFGFFVRINEHHVEGLIHISNISRSRVNYIADKMMLVVSGSNKKYLVGDEIKVKLKNVSVDRGFIDFELADEEQADESQAPKTKRFAR